MIKILMICIFGCQLKSRKLEELAEQIRSDRAKHDAKGKQVGSSRDGENENKNQDQNQNGDTNNSEGTIASINQEKMDEMFVSSCKFLHVSYFWLRSVS